MKYRTEDATAMYCPMCGTEIGNDMKYCPICGADVGDDVAPKITDPSTKTGPGAGIGPSTKTGPDTLVLINKKSEFLAVLLSFLIPGLGHLYMGKYAKGIGLIIADIVVGVFVLVWFPFVLLALAVWFYGMYDAYRLAEQYNMFVMRNKGQKPWRRCHSARPSIVIDRLKNDHHRGIGTIAPAD